MLMTAFCCAGVAYNMLCEWINDVIDFRYESKSVLHIIKFIDVSDDFE